MKIVAIKSKLWSIVPAALPRIDENPIPPWLTEAEYLDIDQAIPDDFGDPDFITPDQYRIMAERECAYEDTPERRMAWRLLALNLSDCFNGKLKQKIRYINDQRKWAKNDGEFPYPFEYWCDVLGFNESWARKNYLRFLDMAEAYAKNGTQPPEITKIIEEVVGKYKARPASLRATEKRTKTFSANMRRRFATAA